MKSETLSLVHRVQEPRAKLAGPPPLLLLLHGFGSHEDDLFGLAPYLDARFFITSARAPIDLGYGYAWFNIEIRPQGMVADLEQVNESHALLLKFIDELVEAYGVDRERVYLMGFSQGAMMALGVALNRPDKLAGVVAMSGRFPAPALSKVAAPEALEGLPVCVTHGLYDTMLPIENGREARDKLKSLPVVLTYKEYPMAHEVSMESLRDVANWLTATLDAQERR